MYRGVAGGRLRYQPANSAVDADAAYASGGVDAGCVHARVVVIFQF